MIGLMLFAIFFMGFIIITTIGAGVAGLPYWLLAIYVGLITLYVCRGEFGGSTIDDPEETLFREQGYSQVPGPFKCYWNDKLVGMTTNSGYMIKAIDSVAEIKTILEADNEIVNDLLPYVHCSCHKFEFRSSYSTLSIVEPEIKEIAENIAKSYIWVRIKGQATMEYKG